MIRTILTTLIALILVSGVYAPAGVPSCSAPGVYISGNADSSIVVCDDPSDTTCEQDFGSLCPAEFHLCTADEYNTGNDNWDGTTPTWLLGEITCRAGGGAGHYTVYGGLPYSQDVAWNQIAGSELPECLSGYGCNEQGFYALCCAGGGYVPPDGNGEIPPNGVPEFGIVAAAGILAAAGYFISRKRR